MSDVACCVCSVYKKMFDLFDIGLMVGGKLGKGFSHVANLLLLVIFDGSTKV